MVDDAKTAILLPPLSFLDDAPLVTMFSRVLENNVLVTYPVSLYTRESKGEMKWLGFVYAFLYTGKDGKKVAHITYPLCFDDNYKKEIYERLLKETEELASAFGASRMEYQGYQHVTGDVFKPLSGIKFGNTLNADFLDFVKEKGFVQKEVRSCYKVSLSEIPEEPVNVYTISDFPERKQKYLELCRVCDSFPQLFDMGQVSAWVGEHFFDEEWVIFAESGEERGVIRWFPQSLFGGGRGAKVVRLLFCGTPQFMCASIAQALSKIARSGIDKIQIADIPQGPIENAVKKWGWKVYETVDMVYYYGDI
ncbi:MAG: hypothetical protein HXS46_06330 [Theionarchaea archaeon]|nr:MAG: hypothetical protein AYK18_03755 [Theionarchaea archaeon DG-70]MBU7010290.1 hypothetical protein [Theionarchaea archaeon]